MVDLTDEQETILLQLYKDPKVLGSVKKLYDAQKGMLKLTQKQVKDWYDSIDATQVTKKRNSSYASFVASKPLEQFQIDLIYMKESWHNRGYKYLFCAVDVFSKKAAMVPLKVRDKDTTTKAMQKVFNEIGIPKTIYSDQGSEFDNKPFHDLLNRHNIEIIFALDHAPFVESFNKTMKNKMYKYMRVNDTKDWASALPDLVDAYNDTKHSTTKMAPNDVNKTNIENVRMNIMKKAKTKNYPKVNEGDSVRIPIKYKETEKKGYNQQWSTELYTVDKNLHNGLYEVNDRVHPRKDLQLVKTVKELPKASKQTRERREKADEIGRAKTNVEVKDLTNKTSSREVKNMLEAPRQTRSQARTTRSQVKK
jgi:hypothetical protein